MDNNSKTATKRPGNRIQKILAIAKLLVLLGIVAGIPLFIFLRNPALLNHFKSPASISALLDQYKWGSVLFFIVLQVFQVIVSVIPGQAIQIAAGYSYHFWSAYFVTLAGVGAGTVLTYNLARLLGKDAMHLIFGEERIGKFIGTLNSKKAYTAIFIIYLIPGIPKDLFIYAAGISEMKGVAFIPITLAARTPALMASVLFGGMLRNGSYAGMAVMAAAVLVLLGLGVKYRAALTEWMNRAYDRFVAGAGE
ncbi:MAG: VTT domain-containing protein [Clostridiales Family XIII bacterium]|nr:VTT domain-containing protein [Clostridiales Family XIII bacterium]